MRETRVVESDDPVTARMGQVSDHTWMLVHRPTGTSHAHRVDRTIPDRGATVQHLRADPARCSARSAPSVSNLWRGAVALRPSMPELSQLRLSWRGSYAPSRVGRAMNSLDLSRWGLWVISTGLGSFGIFCLYFSMLGAPVAGHAFICLGTATAIALALEKIRPTGP